MSKILSIVLDNDVDTELAKEIVKESVFVSDHLQSLAINNKKVDIEISSDIESEVEAVEKKVRRYISAMVTGHRAVPEHVLAESEQKTNSNIENNVFEQLSTLGWVYKIGNGHLSFSGPALNLFNYIDECISTTYDEVFSPEDRHFPAMLPASVLAKSGYFDSHPNNVSFATHLKNDFDVIEEFRQKYGNESDMDNLSMDSVATPHVCLNPAACLPCYFTLKNTNMESNLVMSWLGRVFRHESKNVEGLERLWEYNVRELVFVGDTDFVHEKKQESIETICDILGELELDYRIVSSTDPFFATVSAIRKLFQKSMQAKYEIKLKVSATDSSNTSEVAAGSINIHDAFFGERFNIKSVSNEFANSACIGLGIERIMLACFAQHGVEPDRWPSKLADKVFANVDYGVGV